MAFTTAPHSLKIDKPWGYEIIWTPPGSAHTGKLLSVNAGRRLSLQYHDAKRETLCLLSGRALLWLENADGVVEKIPMEPRRGYDVEPFQKHRIEALEDSLFAEVSDPERGNTVRVEDDFARGTETEAVRAAERSSGPAASQD